MEVAMKKRILIVISLSAILLIGAITSYASSLSPEDAQLWAKIGQLFKSGTDISDDSIFAKGKSGGIVTKEDIEQATEFYVLAGYSETESREKAIDYMLSRDAMYQKAISEGYSVTDDEIWDYLEELKVTISQSENAEQAQILIDQFDSEEEYWQHEFEVYQINLPIEKYMEVLQQEYLSNYAVPNSVDQNIENIMQGYSNYIDEVKADLVESEQYTITE